MEKLNQGDKNIRKRKQIDFTMEDLEQQDDEDDKEYSCDAKPNTSRIMPKRKCKKSD